MSLTVDTTTGRSTIQYPLLVAVIPPAGDTTLYPIKAPVTVERAPESTWCREGVGIAIDASPEVAFAIRVDAATARRLAADIYAALDRPAVAKAEDRA